jgi:hypothetical protein
LRSHTPGPPPSHWMPAFFLEQFGFYERFCPNRVALRLYLQPSQVQCHPEPPFQAFNISGSIGSVRTRLPDAAKIALQRAGIAGGNGGSPNPVGGLSVVKK